MENIFPATQKSSEKSLKELSPQEFQHMLSSWFEEKGIVQDMKSYLKFQMINVLKNTAIGKNIKKSASQTCTLGQQAMHLIVAEYLLHHQCHFALSLFSTEVSLSNLLPETKVFLDQGSMCNEEKQKFDKGNVVNILELIGISKESPHFKKILQNYFEGTGNPLLLYLLAPFGKDIYKASEKEEYEVDEEYEDDFMRSVCHMLQSLNLPHKVQTQLLHNLKVCYDLKSKSYENQVVQLVNKFKKELHSREAKLHRSQKRRQCLEKRLSRLKDEKEMLQRKLDILANEPKPVQSENVIEKLVSLPCSLCHCNDECTSNKRLCISYKKEVDKLKTLNNQQKDEIERLTLKCDELIKEVHSYASKINLVNSRLQEDIVHELQRDYIGKHMEEISLSSDSITEEILQQAREKLRLLEEESEKLDIRFSNFVIK